MSVYLDRGRKCATATITANHTTMSRLTTRIKNLRHTLNMDSSFSSPDLFDDLHMRAINCSDTVRSNQKRMLSDFERKLRLKQGHKK
jgi:hypothetical protein